MSGKRFKKGPRLIFLRNIKYKIAAQTFLLALLILAFAHASPPVQISANSAVSFSTAYKKQTLIFKIHLQSIKEVFLSPGGMEHPLGGLLRGPNFISFYLTSCSEKVF